MPIYPDLPNPDLLDRIPPDAGTVLDVGCGCGALGEAYLGRNPRCRYLGIESDPERAETAAHRLSEVACVDVEATPLPFGEGPFDCIIYGDSLEHLRDPWDILIRHAAVLSENGVILICMPNAEHWSFAERLLSGRFDYEPSGLFDRTHLRWFTRDSMQRALEAAPLSVVDVAPRIFAPERGEAFIQAMTPALAALGVDVPEYRRRALPLQHVWRAMRRPPPRLHVRSSMLDPVGGVSHVRIAQPCRALASCAGVCVDIVPAARVAPRQGLAAVDGDPGEARIFLLHRPVLTGPAGLAVVEELIAGGWLVLCEFDDHPGAFPAMRQEEIYSFRAVHAVQTSTTSLAGVLRAQNPEIAVFPNAIASLPRPVNFRDPGHLTMLFAGINRSQEWPAYIAAINAVTALAGERLTIRVIADRGFFEALDTPHKTFTPLCDYDTYLKQLSTSEICFMPLRDNSFNRCKSDLKFIEAAAHRVVPLASPTVYADSIEEGKTGLIFRTPADLERQLLHLLAAPDRACLLAETARSVVAQHRMLGQQTVRRLAWYRSLWDRRHDLHQALVARVPQLAGVPFGGHRGE